jgi:drug/metabolite transporter (DMT)-like permease
MGILFILLACFLWAMDAVIRFPLVDSHLLSSTSIVFWEHFILSFIYLPFLIKNFKDFRSYNSSQLFSFFFIGVIGSGLATWSFTEAFLYLNPSLVILLQKFQPVVAVFLARVILKETFGKEFLLWAIVCLAGGVLIGVEELVQFFKQDNTGPDVKDLVLGFAYTTVAIIGWGGATVFAKKLSSEGVSSHHLLCGRFVLGFLCLFPMMFTRAELDKGVPTDLGIWANILTLSLVAGLAAMYLFYVGLKRNSARVTALAETSFPFSS